MKACLKTDRTPDSLYIGFPEAQKLKGFLDSKSLLDWIDEFSLEATYVSLSALLSHHLEHNLSLGHNISLERIIETDARISKHNSV